MRNIVVSSPKYGDIDINGNAKFGSWKEFILDIRNDYYDGKQFIFENTFWEKSIYDRIIFELENTIQFLPEDKYLIHGDLGHDNTFVRDQKIVAITDWEESKYGDFVYDIAWLDFWGTSLDYASKFLQYFKSLGEDHKNYQKRLYCYQCHIGLGTLAFYVKTGQKDNYNRAKERILNLCKSSKPE
ncbi:phosphotransferase [Candidatus Beckwithbacteria bacterium]|nr:phosphotransferase [Candidatus Beckwithbacteria bacterium]